MRKRSLFGLAVLVVVIAGVGFVAWNLRGPRAIDPSTPAFSGSADTSPNSLANSADPVKRGLYLAQLGDCVACHTAPGGKPFAGGLALDTGFGIVYASNITPDKDTGIGGWTDQEYLHAVRDGVGRHGAPLYPAMPYNDYALVSDQDLLAIKAYLNTVPAVSNKVPDIKMPFPFNIRQAMWGWNLLFFKNHTYVADAGQSAEWNRGAYLVLGLGHCTACHTPKNFIGGDKGGEALQGFQLQGWYAPELSNNPYQGLGKWSIDELVGYLKTGGNVHSVASGPMAEAVYNSTQHFNNDDLKAMAVYLKSLPGSDHQRPDPLQASDDAMKLGQQVYAANCAACHISSGTGVSGMVTSFSGAPGIQAPDPSSLIHTVLLGSRGAATLTNPTAAAMPNFSWKLSDAQTAAVLTYIRNAWGNAAEPVTIDQVASARAALKAKPFMGEEAHR